MKEPKERLAKWLAILSEYDYTVQYIQGQLGADALSRMPDMPDTNLAEYAPQRRDWTVLCCHAMSIQWVSHKSGVERTWQNYRARTVLLRVETHFENEPVEAPRHWNRDSELRSYWHAWKHFVWLVSYIERDIQQCQGEHG